MNAKENLAISCGVFQFFGLLYFSIRKLDNQPINSNISRCNKVKFVSVLLITALSIGYCRVLALKIIDKKINIKTAIYNFLQFIFFLSLILISFISPSKNLTS